MPPLDGEFEQIDFLGEQKVGRKLRREYGVQLPTGAGKRENIQLDKEPAVCFEYSATGFITRDGGMKGEVSGDHEEELGWERGEAVGFRGANFARWRHVGAMGAQVIKALVWMWRR